MTTPLDPDSPRGREVAAELTEVFAEIRLAIAARKAAADVAAACPKRRPKKRAA